MEKLFIPNKTYHEGSGISNSGISEFIKSPYHFWYTYLSGQCMREETPAMRLGTAVHAAILEPALFEAQYVRAPDVDRRTKEGKEAWANLPSNAIALRHTEYDTCISMRNAIESTNVARKLLADGEPEASYYVEMCDLLCKCRPDWVTDKLIVDVKTTEDASESGFKRSAMKYGYHRQAAFYLDVLEAYGEPKDGFVFMVVEKNPPYATAFYYAADDMIEAGRREYMAALETMKQCFKQDRWPGYPDQIQALTLPEWYK